ncbi:AAA family ATPase [Rhizobium rhizogenes]|uniref:AAA family ATPase n=1 Tax=Rhizobium rhizogenes TaxID=359 RepID=UPI001573E051|nr:AAA family ATPase [Rhizobium rhizogenes]NTF64923.1 AAA family ATPase [Rhizobium rhizogenes]NTG96271.1 AAA family ATPase [Rhizobium rhizogenes]
MIIVGFSGVGKTSAGEYLNARTAATHVEASKYMRQIWTEMGGNGTLQSFAKLSLTANPTLVADRILHDCYRTGIESVVITGFRSPVEVGTIRRATQNTSLLLLTADPLSRLTRLKARGRNGDPLDLEELAALDRAHLDMGMSELISESDTTLDNSVGSAVFQQRLEAYAKNFLVSTDHQDRLSKSGTIERRHVFELRAIGNV